MINYRHGVYADEVSPSVSGAENNGIPAGLPVVFGTAPLHLAKNPATVNRPILINSYKEAVDQFGYSNDWENYTLCEFIDSHFANYKMSPAVLVNVLNPEEHKEVIDPVQMEMNAEISVIDVDGVLIDTVKVQMTVSGDALKKDIDYAVGYNENGKVVITRLDGGSIPEGQKEIFVGYTKLSPQSVTTDNIIGGIDAETDEYEGLENVNRVFPLHRVIPGLLLAPKWSTNPEVAAVMEAKASNINGHFKCTSISDVPTGDVKKYLDVPTWKEENNLLSTRNLVCWPKVKKGKKVYHLSTQLAGDICRTDFVNSNIPYVSPSNKKLEIDGTLLAEGKEIALGPDQATYLNGQGIVTALNFVGGWRAWGNRTSIFPKEDSPAQSFIPVRRMFDWVQNSIILKVWDKEIDAPIKRRQIESIVDELNIWFNGLSARGYILGGRVEFLKEENSPESLQNGKLTFHVYVTPPSPAREINFIVEYDQHYITESLG